MAVVVVNKPSPNFGSRDGMKVDLIVVHGTAGSDAGDVEWCTSPKSGVSYHDIIQRTGVCVHLVDYSKRAWHAGKSAWKGKTDTSGASVNGFSIGVALSLREGETPTDAQYKTLASYLKQRMKEFDIPMERVVGHYHVSPGRKFDPWPPFDWARVWEMMR